MIATTIRAAPLVSDYVALADYESQTPESFADGKHVLHHHVAGATVQAPRSQADLLAVFANSAPPAQGAPINGHGEDADFVEQKADVFITSENFILFSEQAGVGVSLPYPAISMHALKHLDSQDEAAHTQAMWMQIEIATAGSSDDEFDMIELTIIPPAHAPAADGQAAAPSDAQKLFDAMSNCSDLHPDADEDDDNAERIVFNLDVDAQPLGRLTGVLPGTADGRLPPPMPGSGGWITAENMHQFFDDEGNWVGRPGEAREGASAEEELGEGAGTVHGRDEGEGVNGHVHDADPENKRPRVD